MKTLPWWQHSPNPCPSSQAAQQSPLQSLLPSNFPQANKSQIKPDLGTFYSRLVSLGRSSNSAVTLLYKISMQTPGSFHAGSFQNTARFIQRTQRPHGNYRVSTKPRLYHKNELKKIMSRTDGRNIFSLKKINK